MIGFLKKAAKSFKKGWSVSRNTPAEEKKQLFEGVVTTYAKKVVQPTDPQAEIIRLSERKAKLLPVEHEVMKAMSAHIEELRCAELDAKYPRLNLDFLSFRNKRKQPQFGVFSIDESTAKIWLNSTGNVEAVVPFNSLREYYAKNTYRHISGYRSTEFSTEFNGSIPDEARESIAKAQADFPLEGDRSGISRDRYIHRGIGIIAAVDQWDERRIPVADPLVVGINRGRAWLICSFDLSPIEDYVLGTFTE